MFICKEKPTCICFKNETGDLYLGKCAVSDIHSAVHLLNATWKLLSAHTKKNHSPVLMTPSGTGWRRVGTTVLVLPTASLQLLSHLHRVNVCTCSHSSISDTAFCTLLFMGRKNIHGDPLQVFAPSRWHDDHMEAGGGARALIPTLAPYADGMSVLGARVHCYTDCMCIHCGMSRATIMSYWRELSTKYICQIHKSCCLKKDNSLTHIDIKQLTQCICV